DGEAWSSSALSLALGASQRTVQRALDALAAVEKAQSYGRGRARRWMTPPVPGFATPLLLPTPLPSGSDGRMNPSKAEIVREYGPFPDVAHVHGVTYDGQHIWFASGDRLIVLDPVSGKTVRSIEVTSHAGTAFDGRYLYQIAENRI